MSRSLHIAVCALLLGVGSAGAAEIDFDALPVGANAAAIVFPGVDLTSGVVIDDAGLAALLPGAAGPFATTSDQGLFNPASSAIELIFDTPITQFYVDVVSLPNASSSLLPVLVQGFSGTTPTEFAVSAGGPIAETVSIVDPTGMLTRILLLPRVPCSLVSCDSFQDLSNVYLDATTSLFVDSISFSADPVPEPATFGLVGLGLIAFGFRRRGSGS